MDYSGNSGSVQSSSGGDEEYDSRPESIPAFLNPSDHQFDPQQPPTLFDPSPNHFHAFSQSSTNPNLSSSSLNIDVVQSRGLRFDNPNYTHFGSNFFPGSSSSTSQSVLSGAQGSSGLPSSLQLRSVQDINGARSSSPSDQTHGVPRNPKKRTRASRRAPTTVLTTDTSNFRQMVQEFTGIPAPPFSGSLFTRRLDLFGPGSSFRSGHLEQMGSLYPLRPSAQKVHQQSPFLSSSSSPLFLNNINLDATNSATATTTTTNNNNAVTTSISAATSDFNPSSSSSSYQLISESGVHKQPQNLLNQMLSIQPLLQPSPLHPSINVPAGLGAKSQASLTLPILEELGMSHGHENANFGGLASHVATEGMRLSNNEGSTQDHQIRSLDGSYGNLQRLNSCKSNYSSDFHHDKVLENVSSSRGTEGTVDSWICPSEFRIGDH